jgi:aryl-alcohol dehydrogenase-like predicted oxidoreductase
MQSVLQTGLSSGLAATSGFHKSKPPPMPSNHNNTTNLTPSTFSPSATDKITYRGKYHNVTGSPLIIGAWPWGDTATFHWKDSELPSVRSAWELLLEAGINHIDTAQIYGSGSSERICGDLVKSLPRESFVLQTKFWVLPDSPTVLKNWSSAPLKTLKDSLQRTGLDCMDVYMVHGHIHPQSIKTIAASLADCVEQGLTKTVAVANYSKDDMLAMQAALAKFGIPLAANQCEYHAMRREPEVSGLLEACKENGIVFQSYSSLAQGRLSGKYTAEDEGPPSTYRFSNYPMKEYGPVLGVLNEIAQTRGVSVAGVTLNYNLVHGIVPVVGVRNPEQAKSNLEALGWRLSAEEVSRIDGVSSRGKTTSLWQQG